MVAEIIPKFCERESERQRDTEREREGERARKGLVRKPFAGVDKIVYDPQLLAHVNVDEADAGFRPVTLMSFSRDVRQC